MWDLLFIFWWHLAGVKRIEHLLPSFRIGGGLNGEAKLVDSEFSFALLLVVAGRAVGV